jgi:hypothetical protein
MDEVVTPGDSNGSRVGFRDIYRAVGESEARIVARIDAAHGTFAAQLQDHETRMRNLELSGSNEARTAVAAAHLLDKRVEDVEKKVERFIDREGGIFATLGAGKTLIVVGMAIMGTAIAFIDLLSHLTVVVPTP